jgi:hypothetical protein
MHIGQIVLILIILWVLFYFVTYTENNNIKRIDSKNRCENKEGMDVLNNTQIYPDQTNQQSSNTVLSPFISSQSISSPSISSPSISSPSISSPSISSPSISSPSISSPSISSQSISSPSISSQSTSPSLSINKPVNQMYGATINPISSDTKNSNISYMSSDISSNSSNNSNIDSDKSLISHNDVLKSIQSPKNSLSELEQSNILSLKSKLNNTINTSKVDVDVDVEVESECEAIVDTQCNATTCGFNNLHPILDPRFNMREAAKQCILLEDHLNNNKKRCLDCINKHFLTVDGFLEESISLEQDIAKRDFYRKLYLRWVDIQRRYVLQKQNPNNMDLISKEIRMFRKPLVEKFFDTIGEYTE